MVAEKRSSLRSRIFYLGFYRHGPNQSRGDLEAYVFGFLLYVSPTLSNKKEPPKRNGSFPASFAEVDAKPL